MAHILSIGPDVATLTRRNRLLTDAGHIVHGATRRSDAVQAARFMHFDIALLCDSFPAGYAEALTHELLKARPQLTVLMWSPELDCISLAGGLELSAPKRKAA